jgi:hypothetical protein
MYPCMQFLHSDVTEMSDIETMSSKGIKIIVNDNERVKSRVKAFVVRFNSLTTNSLLAKKGK